MDTIFIPKYQHEVPEYLITKIIHLYMENNDCNCIISSPGYMSKTLNSIFVFVYELGRNMQPRTPYIGFFNGMNGHHKVYNNPCLTIREAHESETARSGFFNPLHIFCSPMVDHRKMMFFIDYKHSMPSELNQFNYQDFCNKCIVSGVLIGSSNQSLETYFGGRNFSSAKKGEADILMYKDNSGKTTEKLKNLQRGHYNEDSSNDDNTEYRNIRISSSIDNINDYNFFKGILRNFLENNFNQTD